MSPEAQPLIHGYLDESLSSEQVVQLGDWIKSDAANAREFAVLLMLHDQLRNRFDKTLENSTSVSRETNSPASATIRNWRMNWSVAYATTACLVLLSVLFLWQSVGPSSASAAVVELNRIIAANARSLDRTFLIAVEEVSVPQGERERRPTEQGRPPKPSLDGATLEVRSANQFVLKRSVAQDQYFITGSNGSTSWAVRPDGPVRYSHDLMRFNRDLPGHEYSLPINNLQDGLVALRTAYDLSVVSEENAELNSESTKRMIAVRKPGFLGAAQIEVTYFESTSQIYELRFIEMPYGPENVTLSMRLVEERDLPADYFDHQSHHDPQRIVEFE